MHRSGQNASVWQSTAPPDPPAPLVEDIDTDICIVGAGMAGLSTAYHLVRDGRRVVVIDDGPIGGGESGRTTAHLSDALDDRYYKIESLHGAGGARMAAASHRAAIESIAAIVAREHIDCGFTRLDGYLFVAADHSQDDLDREHDAAQRAGLAVDFIERAPIPLFDTGRALRFPDQAQFHPMQYLIGLAQAIVRQGGRIFTGTRASEVEGYSPMTVRTCAGPSVRASSVVMATNAPIWDYYGLYTVESAYRTYVIGARVPQDSVPPALLWDTADPYHYVRLYGDLLIVGGEDHKTGQSDDNGELFQRLEAWARERFPIGAVESHWSGQVLEPVDAVAFIGRNPFALGDLYVCTGDSGNGMTHGALAGILISDLIAGRSSDWSGLYDPARITLRALGSYAGENVNVLSQYADWVTEADIDSRDQLAPGTGATLRRSGVKLAVYRDPEGRFHECSAVCPHLGCIVTWNDAEKSWDCPCHGSRFSPFGEVINGPANRILAPVAGTYSPVFTAAGVALRSVSLLGANLLRRTLGLQLRTGF
jgi:glycine/D-amino acid oxidase-like deaminating enzyme/nitrite reductase/ring-hydroxylating ferredoxin subunit